MNLNLRLIERFFELILHHLFHKSISEIIINRNLCLDLSDH